MDLNRLKELIFDLDFLAIIYLTFPILLFFIYMNNILSIIGLITLIVIFSKLIKSKRNKSKFINKKVIL
jgi:hypothetical protein